MRRSDIFRAATLAGFLLAAWGAQAQYKDTNNTAAQPVVPLSCVVSTTGIGYTCAPAAQGSLGHDYSANQPTIPNVGSNFAASGPYASYILISTVPASLTRAAIDVENNSGAQIAIVLDDGTAISGAPPSSASVFALSGGSGAGAQGGSWTSVAEKGRVQVYAPTSTAQVAVRAN